MSGYWDKAAFIERRDDIKKYPREIREKTFKTLWLKGWSRDIAAAAAAIGHTRASQIIKELKTIDPYAELSHKTFRMQREKKRRQAAEIIAAKEGKPLKEVEKHIKYRQTAGLLVRTRELNIIAKSKSLSKYKEWIPIKVIRIPEFKTPEIKAPTKPAEVKVPETKLPVDEDKLLAAAQIAKKITLPTDKKKKPPKERIKVVLPTSGELPEVAITTGFPEGDEMREGSP